MRVLLLIVIVLFSSVQSLYSRRIQEGNRVKQLSVFGGGDVKERVVRWGRGSSENWRLQSGDLRVFMESNRPPSLAEGP